MRPIGQALSSSTCPMAGNVERAPDCMSSLHTGAAINSFVTWSTVITPQPLLGLAQTSRTYITNKVSAMERHVHRRRSLIFATLIIHPLYQAWVVVDRQDS